mmetsp:Transcript_6118/g.37927  ORF Transcript_6118/g.37927 Transcript_6118/m.37927 type:complete len:330 (+) Transcript_6118:3492-4481(+)
MHAPEFHIVLPPPPPTEWCALCPRQTQEQGRKCTRSCCCSHANIFGSVQCCSNALCNEGSCFRADDCACHGVPPSENSVRLHHFWMQSIHVFFFHLVRHFHPGVMEGKSSTQHCMHAAHLEVGDASIPDETHGACEDADDAVGVRSAIRPGDPHGAQDQPGRRQRRVEHGRAAQSRRHRRTVACDADAHVHVGSCIDTNGRRVVKRTPCSGPLSCEPVKKASEPGFEGDVETRSEKGRQNASLLDLEHVGQRLSRFKPAHNSCTGHERFVGRLVLRVARSGRLFSIAVRKSILFKTSGELFQCIPFPLEEEIREEEVGDEHTHQRYHHC